MNLKMIKLLTLIKLKNSTKINISEIPLQDFSKEPIQESKETENEKSSIETQDSILSNFNENKPTTETIILDDSQVTETLDTHHISSE